MSQEKTKSYTAEFRVSAVKLQMNPINHRPDSQRSWNQCQYAAYLDQ